MDYLTSSLFVRDKQHPQLTRAGSTRSATTPAPTTTTIMDSPPGEVPRQSILGFLNRSNRTRGGGTNTANSNTPLTDPLCTTPAVPALSSLPSNSNGNNNNNPSTGLNINTAGAVSASSNPRRRTVQPATAVAQSATNPLGLLRRRRSANNVNDRDRDRPQTSSNPRETSGSRHRDRERDRDAQSHSQLQLTAAQGGNGSAHRIRLVPHLDNVRSLNFEAICRDVRQGDPPLRIGRFTEQPSANSNKLAFKSKVVSRGHAEVWFENGTFFIKDTKSSSGTFLNHIRLSSPNTESRPFPIKDGDILQLGVDYQGGTEEIYRCVKMRVELGREWQNGVNAFNSNALAQLKSLTLPVTAQAAARPRNKSKKKSKATSADGERTSESPPHSVPDCCICLSTVTVCQALFIAPCSHVYHYKCIRPLLLMHHPGFSCPICRTFANLEADVEEIGGFEDDENDDVEEGESEDSAAEDSGAGAASAAVREVPDHEMQDAHDMDIEADPGAGVATRENGDRRDDDELEYVSVEEGVLVNPRTNANPSSNSAISGNNSSLTPTNTSNNANLTLASRGSGSSGLNSQTPPTFNATRIPNVMNAGVPLPPHSNPNHPLPPLPPSPFNQPNQVHVMSRSRSLGELRARANDDQTEVERDSSRQCPRPTHMPTASSFPALFAGITMDSSLVAEVDGEMEGATFLGGAPSMAFGARIRVQEGELDDRMEDGADEDAGEIEGMGAGVRGKRKRTEVCL